MTLTEKEREAFYHISDALVQYGRQAVGTSSGLTPYQRSQYALKDLDYLRRRLVASRTEGKP